MRSILLLALATVIAAADAPAPATTSTGPIAKGEMVTASPRQLTADDLQNLIIIARRQLPNLSADELQAAATSIKRAEADLAAMRAAEPPKAEAPAKKP